MTRKILILFIIMSVALQGQAQKRFSYSKLIDGYWGNWEQSQLVKTNGYETILIHEFLIMGELGEFIIYEKNQHPSKHIVKITSQEIQRFIEDKDFKRNVRKAIKEKKALEFKGGIEYSDHWSESNSKGGTTQDFSEFIDKFPTYFAVNRKRDEEVLITLSFESKNRKLLTLYFKNNTSYGLALSFY